MKQMNQTMSSLELVDVINQVRSQEGKKMLRHDNFMAKVLKVLGEVAALNFQGSYTGIDGTERPCYYLPKREANIMVMSESYTVQAKVYDRMAELEEAVNKLDNETLESIGLKKRLEDYEFENMCKVIDQKVKAELELVTKDIAQRMAALDSREYVLVDGMQVRVDMTASKLSLPVMTITEIVKGTEFDAQLANSILYKINFIKRKGNQWVVDTAGKPYGRDVTSSTTAKISIARWFKGEEANILKILRANK